MVEIDGQEVALPAAVADSVEGATPNTTDIILRKVLVTAVQQQENSSLGNGEDGSSRLNTAPDGSLLVTLAVPPYDAERVVFTAEFGTLWLAVEREDVPEIEDSIKTRGNVYDENDDEDDEVIIEPAVEPADDEATADDAAPADNEETGSP